MIGSWPSKLLATLGVLTLVGAGCGDVGLTEQPSPAAVPVSQTPAQPVPLQGGEFAHVRSDRVIIVHAPTQETVATVIAKQPRSLQWSTREQALYWIETASLTNAEEDDPHTVIRRLNTRTGSVESLYWSRGQMTDVFVSEATSIVAFMREDALYTLEPDSGAVNRVSSYVENAVWSPSDTAMVVSGRKSSEYVTVDRTGAVTTRTPLVDGKRFAGATFVNAKTVLGLQWNDDDVVLRTLDLQSSTGQKIGEWSTDPSDGANDRYTVAVGPEGSGVIVFQQFTDRSGGQLWQWNPDTEKKERLTDAQHLLGWSDDKTVWYTSKQGDNINMFAYDVESGITNERIQRVDDPILIEYTAG